MNRRLSVLLILFPAVIQNNLSPFSILHHSQAGSSSSHYKINVRVEKNVFTKWDTWRWVASHVDDIEWGHSLWRTGRYGAYYAFAAGNMVIFAIYKSNSSSKCSDHWCSDAYLPTEHLIIVYKEIGVTGFHHKSGQTMFLVRHLGGISLWWHQHQDTLI